MDLSLIPICDDNGHQLEYKYQSNLYCNICNKKGISMIFTQKRHFLH